MWRKIIFNISGPCESAFAIYNEGKDQVTILMNTVQTSEANQLAAKIHIEKYEKWELSMVEMAYLKAGYSYD